VGPPPPLAFPPSLSPVAFQLFVLKFFFDTLLRSLHNMFFRFLILEVKRSHILFRRPVQAAFAKKRLLGVLDNTCFPSDDQTF